MDSIWGLLSIYIVVFIVLMVVLMVAGMDQVTAFGAVATCLNNLGPGLGEVASNFIGVGDSAKLLLAFAMVLGRLEIFTFRVRLMPSFWRP